MKTFASVLGLLLVGLVVLTLVSPRNPKRPSEELCGRGRDMIAASGGRLTREDVERVGACDNAVAREGIEPLDRAQNGR